MALYQPKIHDSLVRKLHVVAKRNGIPMTYVLNAILEHHLVNESEPPPYEKKRLKASKSPSKKFTSDYTVFVTLGESKRGGRRPPHSACGSRSPWPSDGTD